MPTLVWVRRPLSGTSSAGASGGVSASAAAAAAAPDSAVSASSAAAVQVALPVVSSKQKATCSGKKTNRKRNRANAATTAKKKSKTTSGRDLPRGVTKKPSGKFGSSIQWGPKQCYIGTFDTPEQASAAYISARKDLDDANISTVGADEKDAIFDAAKKKALESFGGFVPEERDLPTGVKKKPSGRFRSDTYWGGKKRHIGTFDTPEQASAAYMSMRKDLDNAKLSAFGADEVDAIFDAAKEKALEVAANAATTAKKKSKTTSGRDLPRGVRKTLSGKFKSETRWGGKQRVIGMFDTPEQASAAYLSVKRDRDDVILPSCGAAQVDAMFDAAKKTAQESVGIVKRKPRGVQKKPSGKFGSSIQWGPKQCYIGTFDTAEQASAAYLCVRKDLDDAAVSSCGAHEVDSVFDKAKQKAIDSFGAFDPEKRDLPTGVYKLRSGKYQSRIKWGRKTRRIGMFDTPEQASAAYMSVRKDLDDANISMVDADEVNIVFDLAKTKAIDSFGAFDPEKRDLPTGVYKLRSGKFKSEIRWGGKTRRIGMFDTSEQASAAYMSVRKDLDDAKLSALGDDEANATFDEVKTKALEAVGGFVTRDLPQGVSKRSSGNFQSAIFWGGEQHHIGTFDSPEQASAAYMSARKDRDDAHLSALGADEVKTAFDAAKKKALEATYVIM